MEFAIEVIKARLLYHLRKKRVIGGVHTHFDTLKMGFPKHIGKEVEKVAKELIKEGWLITKPTSYGLQVSLNKERLVEIEKFIEKILGLKFD
ncbi:MAG: hypothetical protein Q7S74_05790 [Nanoarchaeota archaeon]|nr:hypothetical protein [Nanoarchaeota archaeon]